MAETAAKPGGKTRRAEASPGSAHEEAKARVHQESRFPFAVGGAGGLRAAGGANRFTNPQYYWSSWVALIWGALLVVRITPVRVRRMDQTGASAPAAVAAQSRKPAARPPPARSDGHHGAHAVAPSPPCLAGRWRRATSP